MRSVIKRVTDGVAPVVDALLLRPGSCTGKFIHGRLDDAGRELRFAQGRLLRLAYGPGARA